MKLKIEEDMGLYVHWYWDVLYWVRQAKLDPLLAEIEVIAQLTAAPLVRERLRARVRLRKKQILCKSGLSSLRTTSVKELAWLTQ